MMIRRPSVAGQFYPYDSSVLYQTIREMVEDVPKKRAFGVMTPHAGYMYSGPVAAKVFSRVEAADTYVILGPNHTGMGSDFSMMTEGVWQMPLGEVRVDGILAREMLSRSKYLEDDFTAHQREHSIEVQLPFIQYFKKDFQIVPIAVKHYIPDGNFLKNLADIANAIAEGIKKTRLKVLIVASTDLTHYESQEKANANDKLVLDSVLALDEGRLFKAVRENDISMCGYAPTAVMLMAAKSLGARKAELAGYMTSGDTTGDYSAVVGYGGIIVR